MDETDNSDAKKALTNYSDFIIIGGGSAGAVLANRLTANGRFSVTLIEAGRNSHVLSTIPISFAKFINNPSVNWLYSSEPDEGTGFRSIEIPRGKILGGSSSINGMVFVRGQSQDYDHWAQLGNKGWGYQDVLPYFKKMETYKGPNSAYRGQTGPLIVTDPMESNAFYDAMFKGAEEIGIQRNPDYNAGQQDGVGMTQATIWKGKRQSTAVSYLYPIKKRKNLRILTDTYVEKLIIQNNKCVGVETTKKGMTVIMRCKCEVIISAGAINSPQLLELSGIGAETVLKKAGIEVKSALPGVGENLRDHYAPRMKWSTLKGRYTYNDRARGIGMALEIAKYLTTGKGFLAMPAAPMRAYVRSREGLSAPDLGISVNPFLIKSGVSLDKASGFTMAVHSLRPESCGSVHIASSRSTAPPKIQYNFLSNKIDKDTLVSGMKIVRQWVNSEAMQNIRGKELAPGPNVIDDNDLLEWVKETAETTYHPVGTCKMGQDKMSVVTEELIVKGFGNLRVVDASIMPTLTSGNTNAPTIMIAEKASDLILSKWNQN